MRDSFGPRNTDAYECDTTDEPATSEDPIVTVAVLFRGKLSETQDALRSLSRPGIRIITVKTGGPNELWIERRYRDWEAVAEAASQGLAP